MWACLGSWTTTHPPPRHHPEPLVRPGRSSRRTCHPDTHRRGRHRHPPHPKQPTNRTINSASLSRRTPAYPLSRMRQAHNRKPEALRHLPRRQARNLAASQTRQPPRFRCRPSTRRGRRQTTRRNQQRAPNERGCMEHSQPKSGPSNLPEHHPPGTPERADRRHRRRHRTHTRLLLLHTKRDQNPPPPTLGNPPKSHSEDDLLGRT